MTRKLVPARLLALVAMTSLVFAACGGAATTAAPGGAGATQAPTATQNPGGGPAGQQPGGGGTADACSLLTAEDIKSVTGYAVSRATAGASGGIFPSGCEWELVADEIVPPSIVLGIMTSGGRDYYAKYFEPFIDEAGNTPIAGLGDKAIDVGFGAVMAVKGDSLFNLQYLGQDDHELELAKKLVSHL